MDVLTFPHPRLKYRVIIPRRFTDSGKRKTEYFTSREAATKRIREIELDGRAALARTPPPSNDDAGIIARALSLVGGNPLALLDAARIHARTLTLPACTVREACELFQQSRSKLVSHLTLASDRHRLLKLIRAYASVQVSALTSVELRRFLTDRSTYKTVRVLFKWLHESGYLLTNPMVTISPVGSFGVKNDVYTPEQFTAMLHSAPRELIPLLVLGGFLGLRTCEAVRGIAADDLYFDRDPAFVHIRSGVAKRTRRHSDERYITLPSAISALRAWRDYLPRAGFLVPQSGRTATKMRGRLDIPTLHNGLRNSFCSYALNLDGVSAGEIAKSAGNSEHIMRRHYIRHMPPGLGAQWFAIVPK